MSLSPDQIEIRKQGITATDIAAILGKHPFRSALDVWLEKTGQRESFAGNERTKWGQLLEPVIRADYAERHGVRVEVPGTLEHREHAWRKATPDGIVYPSDGLDADRGLEIKVHGREVLMSGAIRYGDPGTDDVPFHELIQSMWGMAVTEIKRWDLVVFAEGSPAEYIIDRDEELIGLLVERGERFLVDNVRGNKPPDPDGTESYGEWLKAKWRENRDDLLDVTGQADVLSDLAALREYKVTSKGCEAAIEQIEQRLKVRIADHGGLEWREGRGGKPSKITWRRNKEGSAMDYPAMVTDLRNTAALVATAKAPDLDLIERHLAKLGGGYVGDSATSGIALLKTVREVRAALAEISSAKEATYQKITPGNRPFCTPRTWTNGKES